MAANPNFALSYLAIYSDRAKLFAISLQMLDIQESADSEIQKHPVSRDQYPGSANTDSGLIHNNLD